MRFRSKLSAFFLFLAAIFASFVVCPAQAPAVPAGRVVLVLPFENRSGNPTLNWIGDSFPDTLDRRLNSAGFLTISHDDRTFAYDHLGLPKDFRPSRATTIQIARQLDANFVIVGNFTVANNHIAVQARALSVDDLRLSPPVDDSADLPRLFDAENAIAWKVARSIDPHFTVAESTFVAAPGAVPLPAFEDYIRGSDAATPAERLQRLKAAVGVSPDYASALLALGKEQYAERNFADAATTLSKVPPNNPIALEAGFFLGLARFNSANYAGAESAFHFVADRLPLPEVVNDEGVALSRQGKDAAALFQRATAADPSDEDFHYNLALAFFRRGDTTNALNEVATALKLRPNDNEALELQRQLKSAAPGSKLPATDAAGFGPVERVRRTYSETSYRQAAFQLAQLRSARMAMLPPAQQATEFSALGRDAINQGLMPEAESNFQSAIAADPRSAAAHAGLAEVRERSNDPKDARAEAVISLRLQPNAPALLVLARLDVAQNALGVAADEVSQALQLEPQNTAALALKQTLQSRGQVVR
ncbi:MAG TPA: tetratricopeptide repeat protein [Acidobacteriaceae bacterium]|nr:tetratricopeptide repeat protein [Acidobacteriaceae bacterium]